MLKIYIAIAIVKMDYLKRVYRENISNPIKAVQKLNIDSPHGKIIKIIGFILFINTVIATGNVYLAIFELGFISVLVLIVEEKEIKQGLRKLMKIDITNNDTEKARK